jgi:hypothetical protein
MKLINLIPNEAKREQKWNRLGKRSLIIVVVVVLYMGGQYYKLHKLTNDVASAQSVVSTVKTLQASLFENQNLLNVNLFKLGRIQENYVPLNQFLLFLGTQLDKSIQIVEVVTPDMEPQELKTADSTVVPPTTTVPNLTKPTPTSTPNTKTAPIDVTKTDLSKTNTKDAKPLTESKLVEPVAKVPTEQKIIKLRAVSTSFTALGDTMVKLQNLGYIANVDMKDVETYYSGFASYSFFEMVITLK